MIGSINLVLLCLAKAIRTIGFGAVCVVLALFLLQRGFSSAEVGILLSLTLLQDALVTTFVSAFANQWGIKRVLLVCCMVIVLGGIAIATVEDKGLLAFAIVCGIISPAGYEGGPFGPLEQTIISQSSRWGNLTRAYSWYNMVGFGGAALGALLAGICVASMSDLPSMNAYQALFLGYAAGGVLLAVIYSFVRFDDSIEQSGAQSPVGKLKIFNSINSSAIKNKDIWRLAGLQSIDAFGGGFIVQSLLTLWFYERYHVDATFLGPVYFWCNVIAALSFLLAPYIVRRIGLLNTMVFTHLPCSLALCLLPVLPSAALAAGLLLLRSLFSSLDIPVRQAYTMVLVAQNERPFAAGLTSSARAVAQAMAPTLTGLLMQNVMLGAPLVLAGAIKSLYDVSLYLTFKNVPLKEPESSQVKPKVVTHAG